MIMFTGSTRTGARWLRAGERLIPASLELGGKDAMIVLADADLEGAAGAAAWAPLWNSADLHLRRTSLRRSPVVRRLRGRVVEKVKALRQGMDPTRASLRHRLDGDRAATRNRARHVRDAVAKGRACSPAASGATGLFLRTDRPRRRDHSMAACGRRRVGPTLPIMRCGRRGGPPAGQRLAYGLSSSVWTTDRERR